MDENELKGLCKCAVSKSIKRADIILCSEKQGIAPQISIPFLSKGDVCIATTLYTTGHDNPDAILDYNKISECPYRI